MSVEDKYQQMVAAKEADPALAGLTSRSATSIWRALLYRMAATWQLAEEALTALSQQVRLEVQRSSSRTSYWMVARALEYREGQALTLVGTEPVYLAEDDPALHIVTRAFVNETGVVPVLHVSGGTPDNPVPLTPTQLSEFRAYANDRIRGTRKLAYASTAGDEARIVADVQYYPDGGDIAAAVEAALRAFLLNGIGPNGKVRRNDVEAAVRRLAGVQDIYLIEYQFRPSGATGWQNGGNEYQLQSGYARITEYDVQPKPVSYT